MAATAWPVDEFAHTDGVGGVVNYDAGNVNRSHMRHINRILARIYEYQRDDASVGARRRLILSLKGRHQRPLSGSYYRGIVYTINKLLGKQFMSAKQLRVPHERGASATRHSAERVTALMSIVRHALTYHPERSQRTAHGDLARRNMLVAILVVTYTTCPVNRLHEITFGMIRRLAESPCAPIELPRRPAGSVRSRVDDVCTKRVAAAIHRIANVTKANRDDDQPVITVSRDSLNKALRSTYIFVATQNVVGSLGLSHFTRLPVETISDICTTPPAATQQQCMMDTEVMPPDAVVEAIKHDDTQ